MNILHSRLLLAKGQKILILHEFEGEYDTLI